MGLKTPGRPCDKPSPGSSPSKAPITHAREVRWVRGGRPALRGLHCAAALSPESSSVGIRRRPVDCTRTSPPQSPCKASRAVAREPSPGSLERPDSSAALDALWEPRPPAKATRGTCGPVFSRFTERGRVGAASCRGATPSDRPLSRQEAWQFRPGVSQRPLSKHWSPPQSLFLGSQVRTQVEAWLPRTRPCYSSLLFIILHTACPTTSPLPDKTSRKIPHQPSVCLLTCPGSAQIKPKETSCFAGGQFSQGATLRGDGLLSETHPLRRRGLWLFRDLSLSSLPLSLLVCLSL